MTNRPICRYCRTNLACRPRGLCWPCHGGPAIREAYPAHPTHGRRGAGLDGDGRPPATPTAARQGTPEKLAEMAERAARGESLFHRQDGRG
jgi:hypothetical protein